MVPRAGAVARGVLWSPAYDLANLARPLVVRRRAGACAARAQAAGAPGTGPRATGGRAARRPRSPAAPDDLAAFERDLDTLFATGGLTSDQAAGRAGGASPTVRRRVAEIDAAAAQLQAAELARVPVVSGKASYTRLSFIPPPDIPGFPTSVFPSLQNSYLAEAQLVVPLSDYLLRFPALIDTARLGVEAARIGKRIERGRRRAGRAARLLRVGARPAPGADRRSAS